ncbi:hypothetical protein [Comamonas antarctica]|uniref:Uncharacterized protein n=1 Tax=Comamonas antarctica TaxID=2743470 RepID=A0A6N1WZF5_9BURK|nr:hypothetical protein [Comamonas antarctica]QKV52397.1 hypothetical protein HUK68_05465 [Comamonas antarctica]
MRLIQAVRDEVETASGSVDALCDILAAASDETIRASSVRALLQPVARQLNMAASRIADHVEAPTPASSNFP